MRIIFAGTPDFSVGCLQALLDAGHDVCAVYTQPDRPAGRGRKLVASPVKQLALEHDLTVLQPATLDDEASEQLQAFGADLMVVVAYGLLLPERVLQAPRLGCINVHASLLPRWRGAAPIQRAILAGDAMTGITIMQMDAGLDTGDMLLKRKLEIADDETGGGLHDALAMLGAEALLEAVGGLQQGGLIPEAQIEADSCYAAKLHKSEGAIDWRLPARQLERQIRAFNPWPVCQCQWNSKVLRVWQARCVHDDGPIESQPGQVLRSASDGIDVQTGEGVLRLLQLQIPGKRPMTVADFANGHDLTGARLA